VLLLIRHEIDFRCIELKDMTSAVLPPPSLFSKNSLILLSTRYGVKKTLSYFSGPDERRK
jgi:hypothetical protein